MEQPRSITVGLVVGLPLIAIGLVTGAAYLLTGSRKAAPSSAEAPREIAESPEPAPIERPLPRVSATPPRALAKAPGPATMAVAAQRPGVAIAAQRPGIDARAAGAGFQDPRIRQHAQLVFAENARAAMKQRNLARLRQLHDMLSNGDLASAVAPADLAAMDVGLDCLSQANGFRERAGGFLEANAASEFAVTLRDICQ